MIDPTCPLISPPQARVDRQEFSAPEGSGADEKTSSLKTNIPLRFSHFVSMESSEVLRASTEDLVRILKLKVGSSPGRMKKRETPLSSCLKYYEDASCDLCGLGMRLGGVVL